MTDGTTFLILGGLLVLGVLAFILLKKRHKKLLRSGSTCGKRPHRGGTGVSSHWFIGPDLNGMGSQSGNKSVGMPEHPHPNVTGGFYFDIPHPNREAGHVHYVTFNHGPLKGMSEIRMRYRIEGPDGVELRANDGEGPGLLTIHFQREGDDWSAAGKMETYRWYATEKTVAALRTGMAGELVVSLAENRWTALDTSNSRDQVVAFLEAVDHACCVGFVLGGGNGFGHGVYATGPARFIVEEFKVS